LSVRLLDAQTYHVKVTLDVNDLVETIAFSPDGKTIDGGRQDGIIRLWDADGGVLKRTLKGHSNSVEVVLNCLCMIQARNSS
jgi:WD40 repeat protein